MASGMKFFVKQKIGGNPIWRGRLFELEALRDLNKKKPNIK
jgi:hypothetical protein